MFLEWKKDYPVLTVLNPSEGICGKRGRVWEEADSLPQLTCGTGWCWAGRCRTPTSGLGSVATGHTWGRKRGKPTTSAEVSAGSIPRQLPHLVIQTFKEPSLCGGISKEHKEKQLHSRPAARAQSPPPAPGDSVLAGTGRGTRHSQVGQEAPLVPQQAAVSEPDKENQVRPSRLRFGPAG